MWPEGKVLIEWSLFHNDDSALLFLNPRVDITIKKKKKKKLVPVLKRQACVSESLLKWLLNHFF